MFVIRPTAGRQLILLMQQVITRVITTPLCPVLPAIEIIEIRLRILLQVWRLLVPAVMKGIMIPVSTNDQFQKIKTAVNPVVIA